MTVTDRAWPPRMIVLLALLLATMLVWSAPAAAQGTFICPNGPGPGERQVGMTGGGNGVAAVPVCASDGSGGYAPAPVQMRAIDNYYAAAWHAMSNDAWIAAGYLNPNRASQAALSACNQVMGGGCTLADSNVNGTIVIGRGTSGELYSVSRAKKGQAEKALLDYCRSKNDECIVVNSVSTTPGSAPVGSRVNENSEIFAPRSDPRRRFGAIAWVDSSKLGSRPWTGDVWAVTGKASAEAARSEAQAMCQRDYSTPCLVVLSGSDVFLAVAERDGVSVSAASGPTVDIASRRVLADCRKTKGKCRVATSFSLAQDMVLRFDPFAQGKPYFTAQAWVKGAADAIWSVSGVATEDRARKQALAACKRETKQNCEIASSSFNSRVVLYADNKSSTHVLFVERDVDPVASAQRYCTEAGTTCRVLKVVDAREPGLEKVMVQ